MKLIVLCFLMISMVGSQNVPNQKCIFACPLQLANPEICGYENSNPSKLKSFQSNCSLAGYNCENPNDQYTYSYDGNCTVSTQPSCVIACPLEPLNPEICGYENSNPSELKSFKSNCSLAGYNCENPNDQYTYSYDGNCTVSTQPSCVIACPLEPLNPEICGYENCNPSQLKSFLSNCSLAGYNCENPNDQYTYSYDGNCTVSTQPSCVIACPLEPLNPEICGYENSNPSELKSFQSNCSLAGYNCENPNDQYTYSYDGNCTDSTKSNCIFPCPLERVNPEICGYENSNPSKLKSFQSNCSLAGYNCENPNDKYTYSYDGNCTDSTQPSCVFACPFEPLNPEICGYENSNPSKLKSFQDNCSLTGYNCENPNDQYTYSYNGNCTDSTQPSCVFACPLEPINPEICGYENSNPSQLKSFQSNCSLAGYNCENPNDQYTYTYDGNCTDSTQPNCVFVRPLEPVNPEIADMKIRILWFLRNFKIIVH